MFEIEKGRYLIAVSGGPDSMALLDMARKSGSYIEAGHVNYHKRLSAFRDQKIVEDYCERYGIRLHLLDFDPETVTGNFQEKARIARYEFFADICARQSLDAVLVAHQADDHIETYLMQEEKELESSHYGIAGTNELYGVKVIRPLLGYAKKELIRYCDENKVAYGIDETNDDDRYTRNRIRHQIVERMSDEEKRELIRKIERKNRNKEERLRMALKTITDRDYGMDEFFGLEYLDDYLHHYFRSRSARYILEMLRQIRMAERCVYKSEEKWIIKEYGKVCIRPAVKEYSFVFNGPEQLTKGDYGHFAIASEGDSFSSATVTDEDFPLTIRSFRPGDGIRMRYGTRKINRFFIDSKIGYGDRMSWPVVINSKGDVILVPRIGCDIGHYSENPNLFVIKL